jgi:hypothetical protein
MISISGSTEKATRKQTLEAPVFHRGGTCSDTFTLVTFDDTSRMIHPKRMKVGCGQLLSFFILDDHF